MLRYNWSVKLKGQEHSIQLQMDTILRFFGTGSGRLVVDGRTVREFGCNPFRMLPKGSCEFEIDGKKASIISRFTGTSLFFLVLDGQETPPIESKGREASTKLGR
jgi:hypothetical protein